MTINQSINQSNCRLLRTTITRLTQIQTGFTNEAGECEYNEVGCVNTYEVGGVNTNEVGV